MTGDAPAPALEAVSLYTGVAIGGPCDGSALASCAKVRLVILADETPAGVHSVAEYHWIEGGGWRFKVAR